MGEVHKGFWQEILRPWWVRVSIFLTVVVPSYDSNANQFDLPKISELFGMSGALLPWWGWLSILQAILMAALFEYVRRNQSNEDNPEPIGWQPLAADIQANATDLKRLDADLSALATKLAGEREKPTDLLSDHLEKFEFEKRVRGAIGSDIDARLKRLEVAVEGIAEDRKAIISDYQRMSGVEAKLTERFDEHRQLLKEHGTAIEAHRLANSYAHLAMWHRERMLSIACEIDGIAEDLIRRLANGSTLTEQEWGSWLANYQIWLASTNRWSAFAAFYLGREPNKEIQRIHPSDYDDEGWNVTANQFPESEPEAIRHYKTFRIFLRNWEALSKVIHERVRMQAFEGKQTAEREMIDAERK